MKKLLSGTGLALVAVPAFAQASSSTAPDLTSLSSAVDFSTVSPAILSAGALGIGMLLAWVAVKYVRRVVRTA